MEISVFCIIATLADMVGCDSPRRVPKQANPHQSSGMLFQFR